MANPAYVDENRGWSDSNPYNVAVPTHSEGDLMVVCRSVEDDDHSFAINDSMTEESELYLESPNNTDRTIGMQYKFAGASEPANYSMEYSGGGSGDRQITSVMSFSNIHADVFDVTPVNATHTDTAALNTPDTTSPNPNITTVNDNAMIVLATAWYGGSVGAGINFVAPTGFTLASSQFSGQANICTAYKLKATAGEEIIGDWAHTGTFTDRYWITWVLALKSEDAGGAARRIFVT